VIPRRLRPGSTAPRRPRIGPPFWDPIIDEVADADWPKFGFDMLPWQRDVLRDVRLLELSLFPDRALTSDEPKEKL